MNDRRRFLRNLAVGSVGIGMLSSFRLPTVDVSPTMKPSMLHEGKTLGVIAPGGAIFNIGLQDSFPSKLGQVGLKAKFGDHVNEVDGHLAGTDEQRVSDLHAMFEDEDVDGIIAMRGGSGCSRLLPHLDFNLIKANPKPFIGYSDITSLLIAIYVKTGLVTYHGPVGYSSWNEFTYDHFKRALFTTRPLDMQSGDESNDLFYPIVEGTAEGILIGGNLTAFCNLIGSEYMPERWDDKILFLEEINEEPYAIDRMFMQMKLAGILDNVKAVVLGEFRKCVPEEPEKSKTLEEVLRGYLEPLGVPSFYGGHFGHVRDKFTIPVGVRAVVKSANGSIYLKESAVSD